MSYIDEIVRSLLSVRMTYKVRKAVLWCIKQIHCWKFRVARYLNTSLPINLTLDVGIMFPKEYFHIDFTVVLLVSLYEIKTTQKSQLQVCTLSKLFVSLDSGFMPSRVRENSRCQSTEKMEIEYEARTTM
jgi:hypothetical protein